MQHKTRVDEALLEALKRTMCEPWPGEFRTLVGLAAVKAGFRLMRSGSTAAYAMMAYAEKMLSPAEDLQRLDFDQLALRLGLLLMDPSSSGIEELREIVTLLSEDMIGATFFEGSAMDTIGGDRNGTAH